MVWEMHIGEAGFCQLPDNFRATCYLCCFCEIAVIQTIDVVFGVSIEGFDLGISYTKYMTDKFTVVYE